MAPVYPTLRVRPVKISHQGGPPPRIPLRTLTESEIRHRHMRKSRVLARIRSGQIARICSSGSFLPYLPRLAAQCGFDAVWVDAEHRPWTAREAQTMIAFHHLADVDCIWRPPTREKAQIYRLLEDGAMGLMIPQVNSADEAHALAQAVKFPPIGERGLDGSSIDGDFYSMPARDYTAHANRETFLIVQIETPAAVERMDEIAAVPGVDAVFMGPGDLSLRLGCSPDPLSPEMMDVQKRMAAVAKKHGKVWGRPVGTAGQARAIADLGARLIAIGNDFLGIRDHFSSVQVQLDRALGGSTEANPATIQPTV